MYKLFFVFLLSFSLLGFAQEDETEREIRKTADELSKPLTLNANFLTNMMNVDTKSMLMNYIKENPFSSMTEQELKSLIDSAAAERPFGNFLMKNPRVYNFLVKWLRDKEALPKFISILNKPDEMKSFGFVALGVFILSFILNLINTGNLFKRILVKLMIFIGASVINFGIFSYLFYDELKPTFDIVKLSL